MKITVPQPVEFSDDSFTERGERVYKTLRITFHPFGLPNPIERVITCEKGIGITEEWIEDTIKGCLEALEKDYPTDSFVVERTKPNDIRFVYAGARGVVN